MISNIENYIWNPGKYFGPFIFGDNISKYIKKHNMELVIDEMEDGFDWETYRIKNNNELRIYAEESKITSISSHKYCYYNNVNLIGKTIKEISLLIDSVYEEEIDKVEINGEIQEVYEFDDKDCQVWIENNIAVTIIVGDYEEE